jgi:hypothetical protein
MYRTAGIIGLPHKFSTALAATRRSIPSVASSPPRATWSASRSRSSPQSGQGVSPSRDKAAVRLGRPLLMSVAGVVGLLLVAATWFVQGTVTDPVVLTYWWIGNGALLHRTYVFVKGRRYKHSPKATGRMVAIVRAHEQDPNDLRSCIWSILNQRDVVVDEVHVVDDGSVLRPVQPFAHPRVRWHRTENGGRCAAQTYVLNRLEPADWDFVLMVDGNCLLDKRAVEHQLRALSRPHVTATAGTVIVRNARQNLLTRIADLNVGTSRGMTRAGRSVLGSRKIISGGLTVYRAHIPFEHVRHDLAAADTYGGEDCLATSFALKGTIVRTTAAIAWCRMPGDAEGTFQQRLRWSTDWWRSITFALTSTSRPSRRFVRPTVLAQLVVGPLVTGYALIALTTSPYRDAGQWVPIALIAALFMVARYVATGLYLAQRPGMGHREKLGTWLLLTPAETVCNLLFAVPIKYIALLQLCGRSREQWPDARPAVATTPPPGTIYYSDRPAEGTSREPRRTAPAMSLAEGHRS